MDTLMQTKLLIVLWPFFVHTAGPIVGAKDLRACNVIPGVVIVADTMAAKDSILMNHEKIHFVQAKELWYVGYYFVYVKELIRNRVSRQLSGSNAYYANPLEYEAYLHQFDMNYLKTREKCAWRRYATSKKKKILYRDRKLYYEVHSSDSTILSLVPVQ